MSTRFLLAAVALAGLCVPRAAAADDDLKKLLGTWAIVSVEVDGRKPTGERADEIIKTSTITFDGNTIQTKFPMKSDKGTFKLDPDKKPKQIDSTFEGRGKNAKPDLGINEFDGETLKLCIVSSGGPRPKEFKTSKQDQGEAVYFVLKKKAK
jgi:uncharacterized protein (TIGR03067 family)